MAVPQSERRRYTAPFPPVSEFLILTRPSYAGIGPGCLLKVFHDQRKQSPGEGMKKNRQGIMKQGTGLNTYRQLHNFYEGKRVR